MREESAKKADNAPLESKLNLLVYRFEKPVDNSQFISCEEGQSEAAEERRKKRKKTRGYEVLEYHERRPSAEMAGRHHFAPRRPLRRIFLRSERGGVVGQSPRRILRERRELEHLEGSWPDRHSLHWRPLQFFRHLQYQPEWRYLLHRDLVFYDPRPIHQVLFIQNIYIYYSFMSLFSTILHSFVIFYLFSISYSLIVQVVFY